MVMSQRAMNRALRKRGSGEDSRTFFRGMFYASSTRHACSATLWTNKKLLKPKSGWRRVCGLLIVGYNIDLSSQNGTYGIFPSRNSTFYKLLIIKHLIVKLDRRKRRVLKIVFTSGTVGRICKVTLIRCTAVAHSGVGLLQEVMGRGASGHRRLPFAFG